MALSDQPRSPATLTLSELAQACRQETARWRRDQPNNPAFCLEIFTRALQRQGTAFRDEAAREVLVQIYSEHLRAQINRRAARSSSTDDLIQQSWLRFWQAASSGLSFPTLPAALHYLSRVAVSVVIEAQRAEWRQAREQALSDLVAAADQPAADTQRQAERVLGGGEPDPQFAALQRARFRERCRELISDPLEYQVFRMRFDMALPPRTIARMLATDGQTIRQRSPTARAVSDLIERIMERLQADQEIRDLLQSD